MGRRPCRAAFELNGHNAVGQESNGRKNSQTNAQGAVREGQDRDLPEGWTHPKAEAGRRHDLFNKRHARDSTHRRQVVGDGVEGGW